MIVIVTLNSTSILTFESFGTTERTQSKLPFKLLIHVVALETKIQNVKKYNTI